MSGDTAALMLVDRLTDVLLLRTGGSVLDMAHPSFESSLKRIDERKAGFERLKKEYYLKLAAWEKDQIGARPVKSDELEMYEADMRRAELPFGSEDGLFHPSVRR